MDILSIIGLLLAAAALLVGAVLKGAGLASLVSSAAFMIVIVGTIAAICIQTPLSVMKDAARILGMIADGTATVNDWLSRGSRAAMSLSRRLHFFHWLRAATTRPLRPPRCCRATRSCL